MPPSTQLTAPTVTQIAAGRTAASDRNTAHRPRSPIPRARSINSSESSTCASASPRSPSPDRARAASTRATPPARATVASTVSSPASPVRSARPASRRRTRLRAGASRRFRAGTSIPSASASRAQRSPVQSVLTVQSGDVVGPLAGPLDYSSRGYALLPDGTGHAARHARHAGDDGLEPGGERNHGRLGQPSALLRHHRRRVCRCGPEPRGLRQPARQGLARHPHAPAAAPTSSACRRSRRSRS